MNEMAMNRITCPSENLAVFIQNAKTWGVRGVELRNDLEGARITDGMKTADVMSLAEQAGIRIVSINALQRFNDGNPESHRKELEDLASLASDLGKAALVLCPVNDPEDKRSAGQKQDDTIKALKAYAPVFRKYGIKGLVEPLGFSICSLRTKRDAVQAILDSGEECYRIVHDTFHHFLAGEKECYPEMTGLVHISGVEEPIPMEQIADDHRILIGEKDRMDNKGQLKALLGSGYKGPVSYEAFSSEIQALSPSVLAEKIRASQVFLFS